VNEEAAHEQYWRLVAARVKEAVAAPVKLSKGGKQVLTYMVLESLRRGGADWSWDTVQSEEVLIE
jgi:hypothetical protein